ncbi:MAG TPA: DUF2066 domain-containing protein [Magnetospirillaceae bacterium]|jgi:hypothetical protein
MIADLGDGVRPAVLNWHMHRIFAGPILAATVLLSIPAHAADQVAALYQARTIVTGQREPERMVGFGVCLQDVLIKVSGNPRLADDPHVGPMKMTASHFVTAFRYHDRKEGIPVHDEQGTRDRPYDLFCAFNRTGVDALLASLHEKPWIAPRPKIAVFLGVQHGVLDYVLTRDNPHALDQRASLQQEADRRGIAVAIPDTAQAEADHLTVRGLAAAGPVRPEIAAQAIGADLALSGSLVWDDKILGWICQWRFAWHNRLYRWRLRGVSFDEAFRSGIGGVALILSGHRPPT